MNFKQNGDTVESHLCFTTWQALSEILDSLREAVCNSEVVIEDNFSFKASTPVRVMVVTLIKYDKTDFHVYFYGYGMLSISMIATLWQ